VTYLLADRVTNVILIPCILCRISLVHCGRQRSVQDTALAAAIGFCSLHMKRCITMLQWLLINQQLGGIAYRAF